MTVIDAPSPTPTAAPGPAPTATDHLSAEDVELLGKELDRIRQDVLDARGAGDAAYIRRVIVIQRWLEVGGRLTLLVGSRRRATWLLGVAALSTAKILDNMEIGHNVLHGQWDWMRDPKIHSTTWEWDHATPARQWQRSHNDRHHTYTNVIGMDDDLGYGIMRVHPDQPWQPRYLVQPVWNLFNALIFEYGVTLYDLDVGDHLRSGRRFDPAFRARAREALGKVARQVTKDYVVHPLLSGRGARRTLTANATANLVRNLWSHSVIMCGHFPEGVAAFETDSVEGESRGQWYLRQMLGSANISGSKLMHVMAGNLSHQIEHHLFPDLPSNRYAEVAVRVRDLFDRYDLPYVTGSLPRQVASAWRQVIRLSLPNRFLVRRGRSA